MATFCAPHFHQTVHLAAFEYIRMVNSSEPPGLEQNHNNCTIWPLTDQESQINGPHQHSIRWGPRDRWIGLSRQWAVGNGGDYETDLRGDDYEAMRGYMSKKLRIERVVEKISVQEQEHWEFSTVRWGRDQKRVWGRRWPTRD